MNDLTRRALRMTARMGDCPFSVTGTTIRTPDGRTWFLDAMSNGYWRLYEADLGQDRIEEHDAPDGDGWAAGDIIDYLKAVGQPKRTNA